MKKAIVLMMTLGFIAVITALVLYTLSISQKSFATVANIDAQNQFSLTFKDFTAILKEMTKEVKKSEALETLLGIDIPPFPEPKTGLTVGFEMESYMKKLNLNAILVQLLPAEGNCDLNLSTEILCRPLNRFLDQYEIRDKHLMIDLLLDTVDRDDMELGGETEIASEDIDFAQGKIYSYNHLKKIFDRYYQLSSDKNVFRLNRDIVEEVFWFGDTNRTEQMLDCNTMTALSGSDTEEKSVFSYILPAHMLGGETDYCALFSKKSETLASDPELMKIKNLFRISQFDLNKTKSKYLIKCNLTLGAQSVENELRFSYDLIHKRIDRIEESVSK
ncbi:MAG: hypothetical protein DSZ05_01700 [Sulfurospirillum sp.]|nr:MAG: hypothetical protein DSZ05_01700 [Sulfurospirillum sp.]